jgi:holo-[acyl-carrier protein] synthase
MIVGLGVDLIDIARVDKLIASKGERALARLFSTGEREYSMAKARPAQHLAARLAVKEAAFKALAGNDRARTIGWRDIEVINGGDGRPAVLLHGVARERADELGVSRSLVTISHSTTTVVAVVVLEADGDVR